MALDLSGVCRRRTQDFRMCRGRGFGKRRGSGAGVSNVPRRLGAAKDDRLARVDPRRPRWDCDQHHCGFFEFMLAGRARLSRGRWICAQRYRQIMERNNAFASIYRRQNCPDSLGDCSETPASSRNGEYSSRAARDDEQAIHLSRNGFEKEAGGECRTRRARRPAHVEDRGSGHRRPPRRAARLESGAAPGQQIP